MDRDGAPKDVVMFVSLFLYLFCMSYLGSSDR